MSVNDDYYREEDLPNDRFHAVYRCYSVAFLSDRERNNVENGGKILLPQSALEQLINQTGVMLFKLSNPKNARLTHCGVLEFVPNDEPLCYLPHWIMHHLLLEEGDEIHVQSVYSLPNATYVRFQPRSKTFLDISNPKAVLEKVLRNFNCLTKGDLISINYLNRNYQLSILELKPANIVSIIECDIEVDFAPPIDYIEPKSSTMNDNDQQLAKNSSTFMPFHGQGNRLNGKIKSNDKEDKTILPQIRGRPNYDYKYGLLQFPRMPLNEISEKDQSSNIFQPFTGEGKSLRQPRNQQPK